METGGLGNDWPSPFLGHAGLGPEPGRRTPLRGHGWETRPTQWDEGTADGPTPPLLRGRPTMEGREQVVTDRGPPRKSLDPGSGSLSTQVVLGKRLGVRGVDTLPADHGTQGVPVKCANLSVRPSVLNKEKTRCPPDKGTRDPDPLPLSRPQTDPSTGPGATTLTFFRIGKSPSLIVR